jgi:IS5 family transposase
MLRERYQPMNLFALVPALSLALDPVLTQLDHLLDDDTLFQAVQADMARRRPRTLLDGRPSTPVEVILRMLVVKHLYGWSYEATERWGSDSLILRQFCRVYAESVPDDTTLLRWANLIQPATERWWKRTSITPPTAPCCTIACGCSAGRWVKPSKCRRRRVP